MKLEPNMYVRIQWGNGEQTISKCTIKIDIGDTQYSNNDFYIHTDKKGEVIYKSMIVKASHNIIDLIEVGDYVNGLRVEESKYGELYTSYTYMGGDIGLQKETYTTFIKDYEEDYIYSIVTKEAFKSIEYKLGDE